jgi:magnesium-transporting ATPase (P-type)
MIPAISFAYENPELDIMERPPRNSKRDHLVNTKLISFAYLQIGMIQAVSGFFCYFYILADYGFNPSTLFFLANREGYQPAETDLYDPTQPNSGNTQWGTAAGRPDDRDTLNWDGTKDMNVDARLFYGDLPASSWLPCRWTPGDETIPQFWTISRVSGTQICYSTEALKYAQGGYLVSIVCVQWADLLICRTRNLSLSQQPMTNGFATFGLFFETGLVIFISYIKGLNVALGTRAVASPHFAIPSFSFFVVIFFYDEIRKIYLRNGVQKINGENVYFGWIIRNTYY